MSEVEFVSVLLVNLMVASASRQLSLMSMVLVSYFVMYPHFSGQAGSVEYLLWFPVVVSKFLSGFLSFRN